MNEYTPLVAAVLKHSGMTVEELEQVAEHGADAGWAGFTYYADTSAFMAEHGDMVWTLLAADADEFDQSPAQYVAGFRCADSICSQYGLDNALAWWALEQAARQVADLADVTS